MAIVGLKNSSGSKPYAFIVVEHPVGYVCTCATGGVVVGTSGTSGSYIFRVYSSGTYTLTATSQLNPSNTVSKTATITTSGQSVRVVLEAHIIYNSGTQYDTLSAYGYAVANGYTASNPSFTATNITFPITNLTTTSCAFQTANKIDLTSYSLIVAEGSLSGNRLLAVRSINTGYFLEPYGQIVIAKASVSDSDFSNGQKTVLDISSVSGEYYILYGGWWDCNNMSVSKLYLM